MATDLSVCWTLIRVSDPKISIAVSEAFPGGAACFFEVDRVTGRWGWDGRRGEQRQRGRQRRRQHGELVKGGAEADAC